MAGTASFLLASACRYAREEDEFASLQPHERESVRQHLLDLRSAHAQVQQRLGGLSIRARELSDDAKVSATSTAKKIHFIRHGQGFHNAKQKEWRSNPAWDGKTEPYTLETDPDFKLIDPKLTPLGESEAVALRPRANKLSPEVMVVSPMRRATQTGLLAFDQHVVAGRLSVVACELAHEISGKHTCDKRLPVATLKATFPMVDYDGIVSEDDPFWGDGMRRETWDELAARAADFTLWLRDRKEQHIVVAGHSALLAAVFNGVMTYSTDADSKNLRAWFQTGEMRTVEVVWEDPCQ
eukprot:m.28453 g.28453  ORF g.28453 m.28453 type:complete len:296 (+) comp12019_c0_seq3:38-925(+)